MRRSVMARWSKTKSITRITVNGRTYASVEEMPPEVRREYERAMGQLMTDRDGNGVPDLFEQPPTDPLQPPISIMSEHSVVKSVKCDGLEDLPPEIRDAVAGALQEKSQSNMLLSSQLQGRREPPDAIPRRGGGLWIRLSWPVLIALVAAVILVIRWVMRSIQS